MIRFSCPQCHREYVLADALAHLPLLCKGCGQRLNVPDPQPEPDLLPPPPVKPAPRPVPKQPVVAAPSPPEPEPPPELPAEPHNGDPDYYNSTVNFDAVERPPPREAAKPAAKPALVAENPAEPPASRRGIGRIVDGAVFLILLAVGAVAAEMLLGKSSIQVLRESSSAPKFPPTDLLIWLAGPVLFGLVYVWLGTRGWTVGGWLRRRAEM